MGRGRDSGGEGLADGFAACEQYEWGWERASCPDCVGLVSVLFGVPDPRFFYLQHPKMMQSASCG